MAFVVILLQKFRLRDFSPFNRVLAFEIRPRIALSEMLTQLAKDRLSNELRVLFSRALNAASNTWSVRLLQLEKSMCLREGIEQIVMISASSILRHNEIRERLVRCAIDDAA